MLKRIHHVGILTEDITAAVERFHVLFSTPTTRIADVERPGFTLRSAMVPVGADHASYIQLIEPASGPGVAELARQGEGAIFEVAFEVDDIEAAAAAFRARGITPSSLTGEPIEGSYQVATSGNRYFYLRAHETGGTRVEIIQVMP